MWFHLYFHFIYNEFEQYVRSISLYCPLKRDFNRSFGEFSALICLVYQSAACSITSTTEIPVILLLSLFPIILINIRLNASSQFIDIARSIPHSSNAVVKTLYNIFVACIKFILHSNFREFGQIFGPRYTWANLWKQMINLFELRIKYFPLQTFYIVVSLNSIIFHPSLSYSFLSSTS